MGVLFFCRAVFACGAHFFFFLMIRRPPRSTLFPYNDALPIYTFPAGTLSGAPKVKAMQLISDFEPHSRGAYGGCIGFIGLNGTLNQAITIRTFVSRNNELWFQAGGGIVANSYYRQLRFVHIQSEPYRKRTWI